MRWGFIGIGRVTDRMANVIHTMPDHQLAIAAGRDRTKLLAWSEKHHPERCINSLEEACTDPAVDAIYVALPPNLHASFSSVAMEAGKTVLCEKPLTMGSTEAIALHSCAAKTGQSLYHATSFPYHPRSIKMRETIRAGTLGNLKRITIACSASQILSRYDDHRLSPELGGGCLLDLGWYCVYATLWFTGLKPVRMKAFGTLDLTRQIWTSAQALVQLEDGVIAHWDCGFDAAGRKWIEFAGSEASMICDDFLRPWDTQKARYWIHGHDGKALCETVNSDMTQESLMVRQIQRGTNPAATESLETALECQRILDLWKAELVDSCNSF